MSAGSPPDPTRDLADQLLVESRQELGRADTKAQILFAVVGVLVGAVVSGVAAGKWVPSTLPVAAEVMWWAGTALVGGGLAGLGAAIWPRVKKKKANGRVTYFAEVAGYPTYEALERALEGEAARPHDRSVGQLWEISRIAMTKYRLIRWSLGMVGVGVVLVTAGTLTG